MTFTTYKWSVIEWHQLVDTGVLDGKPVELLNGEIIEMSPEGIPHSYTGQSVANYIQEIFKNKAYMRQAHPITLDNSEPQPDIAVVCLPETIYAQHHPYSEDIYFLIEVSQTTLQFDLKVKAEIYARNNIAEYWVIDLVNKKLIVHTQPKDNYYQQIIEYKSGSVSPQCFKDVVIPLSKLIII